jgi:hypothetical protein
MRELSYMGERYWLCIDRSLTDTAHRYVPSFILCKIALVLFILAFLAHTFQIMRYRTWYLIPLSVGIGMEVVGYTARSLSAKKDPYQITFFVLQYFFIITAPVFITASIYVCLNKLIVWSKTTGYSAESRSWLKPKLILWGFVTVDIVTTIMQVAGAAMIGSAESNNKDPTTSNNILLAGLAVQCSGFLTFIVLLGLFFVSLANDHLVELKLGGKRQFAIALMIACLLIFLRIIFRLAETAQGVFGFLMVHEAFYGALEFAPVIVAVWILAIWHPGRWVNLKVLEVDARRGNGAQVTTVKFNEMVSKV